MEPNRMDMLTIQPFLIHTLLKHSLTEPMFSSSIIVITVPILLSNT